MYPCKRLGTKNDQPPPFSWPEERELGLGQGTQDMSKIEEAGNVSKGPCFHSKEMVNV